MGLPGFARCRSACTCSLPKPPGDGQRISSGGLSSSGGRLPDTALTDPYLHFRAYGSSYHEPATGRHTGAWGHGGMGSGHGVVGSVRACLRAWGLRAWGHSGHAGMGSAGMGSDRVSS